MSGDKLTVTACPFCGWRKVQCRDVGSFHVYCPDCCAEGPSEDSEPEAWAAWNTRTNTTTELVEALRDVKWQSADRDNMEFTARITYSQMDAILKALTLHDRGD